MTEQNMIQQVCLAKFGKTLSVHRTLLGRAKRTNSDFAGSDHPAEFSDEGLQPADPDPEFFGLPETRRIFSAHRGPEMTSA